MMAVRTLILAALLVSTAASAEEDRLFVANETGQRIDRLFISPSALQTWVRVNMDDVLRSGQYARVQLPERWQDHCSYDLMVRTSDGSQPQWRALDFCHAQHVTLRWDRLHREIRADFD